MAEITKTDLKAKLDRIPPEKRKEAVQRLLDNGYKIVDAPTTQQVSAPQEESGFAKLIKGGPISAAVKALPAITKAAFPSAEKFTGTPQKVDENTGGQEGGNFLSGFIKGAGDGLQDIGKVGNFVLGSTVKPIAQGVASGAVSTGKAAQGAYEGAKSLVTGQGLEKANQSLENTLSEPVDLPWLGNVNLFKKDKENGGLDKARTVASSTGTLVDALSGFANIANPTLGGFKGGFLRGGSQSAAQAAKEEDSDPLSVGLSGLIGGGVGGIFGGLSTQIPKAVNFFRNKRAEIAGLNDFTQKTLKEVTNSKPVMEALKYVKETAGDTLQPTVMEKVGTGMADDYLNLFKPKMTEVGGKIDPLVKSAPKVSLQPALFELKNQIKRLGVEVTKDGQLDFALSKVADDANGQRVILKLWNDFLSPKIQFKVKSLSAEKTRNMVQNITQNLLSLHPENPGKIGNMAETPIAAFVTKLDEGLKKVLTPDARKLYAEYSSLAKANSLIQQYVGPKKAPAALLEKLTSKSRPQDLIPSLQKLGQVTGKDYINETNVAQAAIDIAKKPKPLVEDSFIKGVIKLLKKPLVNKKSAAEGLVNMAKNKGISGLPQGLASKANVLPLQLGKGLAALLGVK